MHHNNILKKILMVSIITIVIVGLNYGVYQFTSIYYPQPKTVGRDETTIACVGDSITYGLGVYYNRDLAWASLLPQKLGNNYKTINYGISNRTLLSTGNYPYNKEEIAKQFWEAKEDIIVFMLGTNDSKQCNWNQETFEKEYKQMIEKLLQKENHPKLYVMIPPKLYNPNPEEDNPSAKNLEEGVIPTIRKMIENMDNIETIDLYSLTNNHPEWFSDGIHPNEEGNEAIANEIAKIISQTYNK